MTGCVKRRSTRTTTVLSCLSLTTVPCSIRFGISQISYFDFSAARFCNAMVFMRAMSRRTMRTRPVFSSCPVARWKRRLNCSFLSFSSSSESWSGVIARTSSAFISLLHDALDEARPDRKLGRGKRERFLGELERDAVHLEQNAARLHPRDPQLDAALARSHADFKRLLGDRHVGKHPDPHAPRALHVTRERAARRLDLTRCDAFGLHRLEAVFAEGEILSAGRLAVDAAFVRFAELGFDRWHHDCLSFLSRSPLGRVAARTARLALGHLLVLRHRVVLHDLALEDPDFDAAG